MIFYLILLLPFTLAADLMQSGIEHVVVLIMENRSFDNFLAWGYEGDTPLHFIPKSSDPHYLGLSEETLHLYVNEVKNSAGEVVFSSPPIKGIPSVAATSYLNSPPFDPNEPFPNVMVQIGGTEAPTMKGFLQDFASLWKEESWLSNQKTILSCMETYTDKELPVLYALARHYAVSDLWFSSVPTQTNPNRAFAACGTSEGQVVNGTLGKSSFISDTIWNRLTELSPNTSWTIFWEADMVPEVYSGPVTSPNLFASMAQIPNLASHYMKIDQFHTLARQGKLPHFSFIEPQMSASTNLDPEIETNFVMLGVQGDDFHPPGDIRTGENLLANVYTSLISNRETWEKTLLIITFDEHGGLFDHVPPPKAVPPDNQNGFGFNFDRYGVRVPTLLISPRIAPKTIIRAKEKTPFDHTSLIATLFKWKKIPQKAWRMGKRVDGAPTFENVVTLKTPRQDRVVEGLSVDSEKTIHFGDRIYLHDQKGNYLVASSWLAHSGPIENRMVLTLEGGPGALRHGSFALVAAQDQYLGTSVVNCECFYSANSHDPKQWWTVKSMEHPFLGDEIQHGDKIYFENHIYVDLFQYVPGRLSADNWYISSLLTTQPVTKADSDQRYWIIEKVDFENKKG